MVKVCDHNQSHFAKWLILIDNLCGYDKFNVIQTECIWNEIRKVLDFYYLCIQLSVIYVKFLDALVVCWRQNFLENDDFWKVWSGGKKIGEEGIFF
jgi:hypothetical protein